MTTMRRHRLAALSPTALVGGAERSLLELVQLTRDAIDWTLLVPAAGPLPRAAEAAGARAVLVPWPKRLVALGERGRGGVSPAALLGAAPAGIALVARLRRALATLAPDVVVTNGIKAHALGALACPPRTPLVWYGREGLEDRPRSTQVLRALAGRCDAAIAISRYVGGELRRVLPARVPIEPLPNVVDLEAFRPGLALPGDLAKAPGTLWFGVVGALTPLKGQDLFLEAAARIEAALPQARFLVVGSAQYASEAHLDFEGALRRAAAARGLGERVLFLGERHDVPAIVANLDALVQPNRGPEGLGRAVLEAMACAVPVVAVDRWGPAELVVAGETGLLHVPGDVAGLAAHLAALGADAPLRRRLGEAGRRWILTHLDRERIAARFVELVRGWAPPLAQPHPPIGR